MIEIIIPGTPLPWRAPYVGTRGAYSPRTAVMNDLRIVLKREYSGSVFVNPINVDFEFYMPIPVSTSKKKRVLMLERVIMPSKIPDLDNLRKFGSDLLQGIAYENDSIIVSGYSIKVYGENPRTVVKIQEV